MSRTPCILSGYSNVDKDNAFLTSILDLLAKKRNRESKQRRQSQILQSTVLSPKTREPVERPVIDLSSLNQYIPVSKFKMKTPESIRASLRQGEWVTLIDLSDAYLHLPIHPQSRKFLRFHHKGVSYQFSS